ncbi:uncharacterized protein LOC127813994 isoform X2 [Diospyros lotus]|uniref:uncharacterized protein LOC127813994 isoform X2 n=1 Tax=Diospyros lotus TaxID=55363 RepID=UPI00224F06E3|nr:uncharacterized protein LOC127813994 isoform X2 [Diospyros lotus]
MKRRSGINSGQAPKIRSSSVRGFNGVRSLLGNEEITNMSKDSSSEFRSSSPIQKERHISHNFLLSPHANVSKSSDPTDIGKISHKDIRSPLDVEKITPMSDKFLCSPLDCALRKLGSEYLDGEVFSGKRKRLYQLALESLPEVEKLCSDRCNLVSILLNRLFPDIEESNCCRDARPAPPIAGPKFSSDVSHESDTYCKGFYCTERRDLVQAEHGWYSNDFCQRSIEISPLNSPAAKEQFQYENKKYWSDYEGGTASLVTVGDPYYCTKLENYGTISSNHIKKLNRFQDTDEFANGIGPRALLLSWDFNRLKDKGDSSITSCSTEIKLHSAVAASWDDHQQDLDSSTDAGWLCSSTFFSDIPSKFTSLPHCHSWDFERFLEEEKFVVGELKHRPLTLSDAPNCLNLRGDSYNYNSNKCSSLFSHHHYPWTLSKLFNEKCHPDFGPFVLHSGLGFDLKSSPISSSFDELNPSIYDVFHSPHKECPDSFLLAAEEQEDYLDSTNHRQIITHCAKDIFDSNQWSSINSRIPLDKEITGPLLLDCSSWIGSEEDNNNDDKKSMNLMLPAIFRYPFD